MARASRVLLIYLDGFDPAVAERLVREGRLAAVQRLMETAARVPLDHGRARFTGLAGEHLSTGLAPEDAARHAAVTFDPATYRAWQAPTDLVPFPDALTAKTVVVDPTYFDLARASRVDGLVGWGAHDPGAPAFSRPDGLAAEANARFGAYLATDWIYGFAWPSAARAAEMGAALTAALDQRANLARWLLGERLPDWEFGVVVSGEIHSAVEGLWHGFDEGHPLHDLPSAEAAGRGVRAVYEAADRLVGTLAGAFPDATLVVASYHGMGPNRSDVASMALLAELLLRDGLGESLLPAREAWKQAPLPMLEPDESWERACTPGLVKPPRTRSRRVARFARRRLRRLFPAAGGRPGRGKRRSDAATPDEMSLAWMPAARFAPFWPRMPAFALPSFYDGRVRLNVEGRERDGSVPVATYGRTLDRVEALVRECRDTRTGEPVVEDCYRPSSDPFAVGATGADLIITWRGAPVGFDHPRLGRIGPLPFRRPGGHSGGHGVAFVHGHGIAPGHHEPRSAFDLVPTIVELLGEVSPSPLTGRSFLPRLRSLPSAELA